MNQRKMKGLCVAIALLSAGAAQAEEPISIESLLQEMVDQPGRREKWAAAAPEVLETFNWDIASQIFRQRYKSLHGL